jgi:hypothetical protein
MQVITPLIAPKLLVREGRSCLQSAAKTAAMFYGEKGAMETVIMVQFIFWTRKEQSTKEIKSNAVIGMDGIQPVLNEGLDAVHC